MQNWTATLKSTLAVSYKVKPVYTLYPRTPTPRYMKKFPYTNDSLQMFIVTLLTIKKKTWEQFKCPLPGE